MLNVFMRNPSLFFYILPRRTENEFDHIEDSWISNRISAV